MIQYRYKDQTFKSIEAITKNTNLSRYKITQKIKSGEIGVIEMYDYTEQEYINAIEVFWIVYGDNLELFRNKYTRCRNIRELLDIPNGHNLTDEQQYTIGKMVVNIVGITKLYNDFVKYITEQDEFLVGIELTGL